MKCPFPRFAGLFLIIGLALQATWVRAEHPNEPGPKGPFYYRQIFFSDSPTRVMLLQLPAKGPKVAVDNLPLLSTKEFGDFIATYIGREITQASLGDLIRNVTDFVHRHGQPQVEITLPAQNVSDGRVRFVVVIGRYNLGRLLISNTEPKAEAMVPPPGAGQIVVEDIPLFGTQAFATAMAPFFGQPITDEAVNRMATAIDTYAREHGEILAHIALPKQNIATGELRVAVAIGVYPLRRLVLAETPSAAQAIVVNPAAGPIVAPDMKLFQTAEFRDAMAKYLEHPISRDSVDRLRADIVAYAKAHDRLVVNIPQPQVDLATGELRLAVPIARYGQIQFQGNRWFSKQLLAREMGVHAGEEIRLSELEAAVNRTNQSPFRHIQVMLDSLGQGADPGSVGLAVQAREVRPLRVAATFDDTGSDIIGNNHYTGSVQYGNLWGLDHQLSFQLTTTDSYRKYHAYLGTYRAQLPWHHYVTLAFADASYDTAIEDGIFRLSGQNYLGDARYVVPIYGDTWSLELSGGVDYKQVDNRLDFVGYRVTDAINTIAQFATAATYVNRTPAATTVASVTLYGSPGHFNDRNTDARFRGNVAIDPTTDQPIGGPEAQARYLYGSAVVQRLMSLPSDFQFLIRGQAQLSSARLLSSERLSIGGQATVRGYDERIMSGDTGYAFTLEAHSPAFRLRVPFTPKTYAKEENRFLVFLDDGRVFFRHPRVDDIPMHRLTSAGIGLRSNWAGNFSLSADWGWQLEHIVASGPLAQPHRSRGHIQATIAY